MCNAYQSSAIPTLPVGRERVAVQDTDRCSFAAPISGALSTISVGAPTSKGAPRAKQDFTVQDVDKISNAIVPGYTTPVASSKCVVQDETDIPVALSPVSLGFHVGTWILEALSSATAPFFSRVRWGAFV